MKSEGGVHDIKTYIMRESAKIREEKGKRENFGSFSAVRYLERSPLLATPLLPLRLARYETETLSSLLRSRPSLRSYIY